MTHALADLTSWHKEAEVALNRRDFRRVHDLCMRILAAEPAHADALFLLAMIAAEHGNFRKALEVVDRAPEWLDGLGVRARARHYDADRVERERGTRHELESRYRRLERLARPM